MKKIPLTQGKVALVDDADFEWLSQWNWCLIKGHRTCYAYRGRRKSEPEGPSTIYMHRVLLPDCVNVDHEDGNGLNNQRKNIRAATLQQNRFNQRSHTDGSSKFKGLSWDSHNKKWRVRIMVGKKNVWLGRFSDEVEAAKVYDAKAKELYGEFARLNFPNNAQY